MYLCIIFLVITIERNNNYNEKKNQNIRLHHQTNLLSQKLLFFVEKIGETKMQWKASVC